MTNAIYEECEGCDIYESCVIRIPIDKNCDYTGKIIGCPCRLCLIKVVCEVGSACDPYMDWLCSNER